MANVDGSWNTTVESPMGTQTAVLTVKASGSEFSGTWAGSMGTTEVKDGKVDGDKLTWKLDITVPMPMTLDCEATVDGNTMTGTVTAGAFGAFPLKGTRG